MRNRTISHRAHTNIGENTAAHLGAGRPEPLRLGAPVLRQPLQGCPAPFPRPRPRAGATQPNIHATRHAAPARQYTASPGRPIGSAPPIPRKINGGRFCRAGPPPARWLSRRAQARRRGGAPSGAIVRVSARWRSGARGFGPRPPSCHATCSMACGVALRAGLSVTFPAPQVVTRLSSRARPGNRHRRSRLRPWCTAVGRPRHSHGANGRRSPGAGCPITGLALARALACDPAGCCVPSCAPSARSCSDPATARA